MTGHDVYLLSPEISLVGLALLVMGLDLVVRRKGLLTLVAVAGLALPLALSIVLWVDVSSETDGRMVGVLGALTVDKFALFFKFLILGVTGLSAHRFGRLCAAAAWTTGRVHWTDSAFGNGDDASGLDGGADNHLRCIGADGAAADSAVHLPDDAAIGRGRIEVPGVKRRKFRPAAVRHGLGLRADGKHLPGGDWPGGGDAPGRVPALWQHGPYSWASS